MEPFNLERALAGELVVLRNGEKAEILMHSDRPGIDKPIVGLVDRDGGIFWSWCNWGVCGKFWPSSEDESHLDIVGMCPQDSTPFTSSNKTESSDGSTADYYQLPDGATELQHLISARNMNAQIGEIFRSCYRYGLVSHSPKVRDIKKIIFYAKAELERLEKYDEK